MPSAVVMLDFDPILRLGGLGVRLETLGIAAAAFVGLVFAAVLAGSTPAEGSDSGPYVQRPRLRRDDLLYLALAAVAGAVVGGRLTYGLIHADYYAAQPLALLDPGQGSVELAGAVVGGALTAGIAARLVYAPLARWYHVAALPLLAAISLGKAAMALGGNGQGQPADAPWATAYAGPGPWGSLAPAIPSHPAQLYEALVAALVLFVLAAVISVGGFAARDGRIFLVGVAAWLLGRAVVAFVWRDASVLGPLNAGQLMAVVMALGALVLAVVLPSVSDRVRRHLPSAEPRWPDPKSRPRF